MTKKISILGCGWLGLPLANKLSQIGYFIKGSTTSASKAAVLKSKGIIPYIINLGHKENKFLDFLDAEILIICIPSKNKADFKRLIAKIEESEIQKVIFISSISVYPLKNQLVTEDTAVSGPLAEIEKLFISSSYFSTTIIRFGGLFGYDRKPGKFIKNDKPLKNPDGFVNLIHRDDCTQIIENIIQKDVWNEVFNASADTHPKRKDFYKKEMLKMGRAAPLIDKDSESLYKIISSEKLKTLLNYSFIYSDLLNYEN